MKIVVIDTNLAPLRAEFDSALPDGADVHWPDPADEAAILDALTDADALVAGRFTAGMSDAGKHLRAVFVPGAGYEKIDISALPAGTQVANTFHHEDSIAEYVVAATVLLRRDFLAQDAALRRGEWRSPAFDPAVPWSTSLSAATIGFVGFGHIGSRTWELFRAFGAQGVAVTRRGDVDAAAWGLEWTGTIDDLLALLDTADVVVVSAPLSPETAGLIGAAELARMGASTFLVNVGRGPIVDEQALHTALRDATIAGAAIDVWYDYPAAGRTGRPSALPFHALPNVLMTPHSSGVTRQTFAGRAADITANIGRLAADRPLKNVVAVAGS